MTSNTAKKKGTWSRTITKAGNQPPAQAPANSTPAVKKKAKKKKKYHTPSDATPALQWWHEIANGSLGLWSASSSVGSNGTLVYRWTGQYWYEMGLEDGEAIVAEWLEQSLPSEAKSSVVSDCWRYGIRRLRLDNPLPKRDALASPIIPLQNAYLEVAKDGTIKTLEADPSLGITHMVNTKTATSIGQEHKPSSVPENSLFGRYLASSLPDPQVRALVQEQCALSFMPGAYPIAAWWWGDGRNGKGVMTKLLQRFHARTASVKLQGLDAQFGLEPIVGCSLILVDEVPNKAWCEETFKSLCSGDSVSVNRKNDKAIASYHNEAMIFISSNSQPFIRDTSGGVYERVVAVHWDTVIPPEERVDHLDLHIFRDEGHIFLDWLLEGVQRIVKRGGFIPEREWPQVVQDLKARLKSDNDSVGAWATDTGATYNPNCKHAKAEVYASYKAWCEEEGKKVLDEPVFWRAVWSRPAFMKARNHGDGSKQITCSWNGKRSRAVLIALTREEDQFHSGKSTVDKPLDIVLAGDGEIDF